MVQFQIEILDKYKMKIYSILNESHLNCYQFIIHHFILRRMRKEIFPKSYFLNCIDAFAEKKQ